MAARTEDQERIRGYLQAQAAKYSIEQLRERVQGSVNDLHAAASVIDAGTFDAIPDGETWSPLQCLSHLVAYNLEVARKVLYVALTGESPGEEERPLPPTRDEIIAAHQEGMDSLYIHLADAEPTYFLETKWEHEMFGDLNWREWFLFLRIHNVDHTGQLTAMKG